MCIRDRLKQAAIIGNKAGAGLVQFFQRRKVRCTVKTLGDVYKRQTDPDADRVGIAMKCPDGSYELVSGNEMGCLLYTSSMRSSSGPDTRLRYCRTAVREQVHGRVGWP